MLKFLDKSKKLCNFSIKTKDINIETVKLLRKHYFKDLFKYRKKHVHIMFKIMKNK